MKHSSVGPVSFAFLRLLKADLAQILGVLLVSSLNFTEKSWKHLCARSGPLQSRPRKSHSKSTAASSAVISSSHLTTDIFVAAEQQTVLSVFKCILNMQNHGCRSGSQQLKVGGASEDDVTHVNHIMALTVQKLETEATFVPVPEEKSLPQERMDGSSEVGDPGTKFQPLLRHVR